MGKGKEYGKTATDIITDVGVVISSIKGFFDLIDFARNPKPSLRKYGGTKKVKETRKVLGVFKTEKTYDVYRWTNEKVDDVLKRRR